METKEQIKQAIAEKISHQGNQIDLGGALDAILNAIVDVLQPVLTAGNNIDISDGVISATGLQPTLTAGENITIEDNVISATGGGGGGIPAILYVDRTDDVLAMGKTGTAEEICAFLNGSKDYGWTPEILANLVDQEANRVLVISTLVSGMSMPRLVYILSHYVLTDGTKWVRFTNSSSYIQFSKTGDTYKIEGYLD